jgi:LacI family transcriptional regulator
LKNNVTIKDIAREAGVSIASVSRVINRSGAISGHMEKRVLDAIDKLGYYPNLVARGLKTSATRTVALLVSNSSSDFYTEFFYGFEATLHKMNYSVLLCNTQSDPEKEYEYLQLMLEKKVDGFVINSTGYYNDMIVGISRHTPVALVSRNICDAGFIGDFLETENEGPMSELTGMLIEAGHRKIGFVSGPLHLSSAKERFDAFQRTMVQIGIKVDPETYPYFYQGHFTMSGGREVARKILASEDRPTALMATNGDMVIGLLSVFKDAGLRVPEDISIATINNISNHNLLYVDITLAKPAPFQMGKRAAEMLVDRITATQPLPNREVRFPYKLHVGNSIKDIRERDELRVLK